MSKELGNIKVIDLLQSCLQDDTEIKALASWIDDELKIIYSAGEKVDLITRMKNHDLEDWEIEELLIQENVDYYVEDLTDEQKMTLIWDSVKSHKRKGTKYAIETNLKTIFEDTELLEWFDYEGDPFHFMIIVRSSMTSDELTKLYKIIEANKNTRSYLDGITTSSEWEGTNYFGAIINTAIFEEISIASGVAEEFESYMEEYVPTPTFEVDLLGSGDTNILLEGATGYQIDDGEIIAGDIIVTTLVSGVSTNIKAYGNITRCGFNDEGESEPEGYVDNYVYTSIHITKSNTLTSLENSFWYIFSLTSFSILDWSNVTDFSNAWYPEYYVDLDDESKALIDTIVPSDY